MAGASVSTQRLLPARAFGREEARAPRRERRRRSSARVAFDAPRLHARGVGQILDSALDVLVERFGVFVGIAACFWLPYQIVNELVGYSRFGLGGQLVSALFGFLPEHLTSACVCSLVGATLLRLRVTTWGALRNGITAAIGVSLIALAQAISTVFGMLLCLFPALLVMWLFSVGPTVYVLERRTLLARSGGVTRGPIAWLSGILLSLVRGTQLVLGLGSFGRWAAWTTVAGLAILWPLLLVPTALADPTVREFLESTFSIQGRPIALMVTAISAVFVGIGTAYFAILKTVYYTDERIRKEALDLDLTLRHFAERGGVGRRASGRA